MKTTIVDNRWVDGQYEIPCQQAIVDNDEHGRLLITDGFGGGDLEGMTYRWRHGLVIKLHDDDTFEILDAEWNDWCDTMHAVLNGQDDSRPILTWPGTIISSMAKSVGLK